MSDNLEKTASTTPRPIAPPSVSQHLREFAARPEAWTVFARNLIPVVGIYFFGWSAGLTVFNYWFDGLSALAAILAVLIPRALRESQPESANLSSPLNIVRGIFTWIFLLGIVGLPYWIVLIPLHDLLLDPDLRRQIAHSPALWTTFGSLAAGHLWKALQLATTRCPTKVEAARALGRLHPCLTGGGDVRHGRARSRLYSGAADVAASDLLRNLARARARCSLRRSVTAL